MISKTFCILPWMHLSTRPNGDYRMCCYVDKNNIIKDSHSFNAGTSNIVDVFNSEYMRKIRLKMLKGEWNKDCERCREKELVGVNSGRLNWMHLVSKFDLDILPITNEDGSVNALPIYLDIRLGNFCNLACRMCSSTDSSKWYKEHMELNKSNKIVDTHGDILLKLNSNNKLYTNDYSWYKNSNFWEQLDFIIDNTDKLLLYLVGGEPLIIKEHETFLNRYSNTEQAKKIMLSYNTNLTSVPDKFVQQWKSFKSVKLSCSVDGMKSVTEYQRWPSKWNIILKNLIKINNLCRSDNRKFTSTIDCVVTIYSVFHIPEFIWWLLNNDLNYISNTLRPRNVLNIIIADRPMCLTIKLLPNSIQTKIKEKYSKWIGEINTSKFDSELKNNVIKTLEKILQFMSKGKPKNKNKNLEEFKRYTLFLDKSRNQNLLDVVPELEELII